MCTQKTKQESSYHRSNFNYKYTRKTNIHPLLKVLLKYYSQLSLSQVSCWNQKAWLFWSHLGSQAQQVCASRSGLSVPSPTGGVCTPCQIACIRRRIPSKVSYGWGCEQKGLSLRSHSLQLSSSDFPSIVVPHIYGLSNAAPHVCPVLCTSLATCPCPSKSPLLPRYLCTSGPGDTLFHGSPARHVW